MGGKTAILAIRIISDAKGAQTGLNDTVAAAGRFERGMNTAKVAAAGVIGGLALLGKEAFDSASRLQQASGAVESVFGAQSAAVDKLAAGAADRLGLAESEYSEFASVLGSQLKNLGIPHDQLVEQQEALQKKAADLAATFGGTTADAVSALSSLMRGERDPIERYGVSINQAAIDSYLAAHGMGELEGQAKKNAETQATLAILTEQTASATGAFAREVDTAAGAQVRATANFENAKATLGEQLLPVVAEVATKFSELSVWVSENSTLVGTLVGILAGLAATVYLVNGALAAYRAIAMIATAMQWLWNAAMLANPLVWIALLIAAVIVAIVICYKKFETFRDVAKAAFMVVTFPMRTVIDLIQFVWSKIVALAGSFTSFGAFAKAAFDLLTAPVKWLLDKLKAIGDKIGFVKSAAGAIGGLFGSAGPGATPALAAGRYAAVGAPELAAVGNAGATSQLLGATPVGSSSTRSTSSAGNVTINVTGALDPVAVARQIRSILLDDDRLAGRSVAMSVSRT